MFVVVFIKSVSKYVVIPEEWIFDVNEEQLKNKGVNSNRDVLVFWSTSGIKNDGQPDATYAPNFLIPKSSVFPPPNDEACYLARTIHYYGKSVRKKLWIIWLNK